MHILLLTMGLFVCAFVFSPGLALAAGVAGTKHNLGVSGPGPIRSADTTEICIFCHTPHHSSVSGPLWNRADSGSTYTLYGTATMAADTAQPTGTSKLCLSCHDGTIAIGSLLNLPGGADPMAGTLAVTGLGVDTDGKLTSVSSAFIGTDLSDDHPISFPYAESYPANTELNEEASFPAGMELSKKNVECTSCHDPHGSAYSDFLVADLMNGGLCTACHDKRYWDTGPSVHKGSTALWNSTAGGYNPNPWHRDLDAVGYDDDTPAKHSCLSCHRSHGGAVGAHLLKGEDETATYKGEEYTCLACHNGNVATQDIEVLIDGVAKTSEHPIMDTSSYQNHSASRDADASPAREAQASLGTANRHSECIDCHNPHGSKTGNHTVGGVNGNTIGNNLLGTWGVRPNSWPAAGTGVAYTDFTETDFTTIIPGSDNFESYMCIKCHSDYAFQGLPSPNVPSRAPNGDAIKSTDVTEDFNINNYAFHPVFESAGQNTPLSTANLNWPANGLGLTNTFVYAQYIGDEADREGFYNVEHTSTLTCSDCHGSDVAGDPKGPHGSLNNWVLKSDEIAGTGSKNFCLNCHRQDVYGDQGTDPHATYKLYARVTHPPDGLSATVSPFYASGVNTGHNGNKFGILCLTCHGGAYDTTNDVMRGIHGSNAAVGPQGGSDPLGYRLMNGACVESYKRGKNTLDPTKIWFRTVTIATDKVCNANFTDVNYIGGINYPCTQIADCSN